MPTAVLLFFVGAHALFRLSVLVDDQWNIHERPALSLAILLMVIGVQLVTLGLLGELVERKAGAARPDEAYSVKRTLGD